MERGSSLRTAFGLPVDDTKRLTYEDYAGALARVIELARKGGALAVYTYGEVSAPGISDLDVIVVSEKPLSLKLSEKELWVLGHFPEVISPEEFKDLGWRMDTRNLQRAWGEDLGEPPVPQSERRRLAVSYAAYRTVALHKAFATGRLRARTLLRHLHALRYNFSLLGLEEPPYFREVELLRGLWFSLGPGRLLDLLELAWRGFEVMEELFSQFGRDETEPKRGGNWLWVEGETRLPRPEPLGLKGKAGEALYYLKVFRAYLPGEALKLLEPPEPKGWRKTLCWLPTFFTRGR